MADDSSTKPKGIMQKLLVEMVFLSFAFTFAFGAWILHYSLAKPTGITKFTAPESKQKVWIKKREPVRFAWVGEAGPNAILEVSRDADFQNLVLQVIGPSSPYRAELPGEGDYFYRIVQHDSDEHTLVPEPVAFTVVTKEPPQLTYPFNPAAFPAEKQIRFYWQAKHGINFYRIQIAFDDSFKNILSDTLVNGTQTTPQAIPVGSLFWRVRGEGDGASTTQWSEVRALQMNGSPNLAKTNESAQPVVPPTIPVALAAPVLQGSQKILLRYGMGTNSRGPASVQKGTLNPPVLKWSKSKGATSYEVQVSKRVDFSGLDWTQITSGSEAKWNLATPGKFFWRVRAVDATANKSTFSNPSTLELTLSTPKMKKSFSNTAISWTEVPAASGYRVLVSENRKFDTTVLELRTEKNLANLNLVKEGQYFVKVAALAGEDLASDFSEASSVDYKKKELSSKSRTRTVAKSNVKSTVQRTPQSVPVVPIEKIANITPPLPKLPPNGVSIVSFGGGAQEPILFKWEVVDADNYRLEIAADDGFQKVLHSAVVNDNQQIVTKPLPKGKLFWRVRAQRGGANSDWSPVFTLEK